MWYNCYMARLAPYWNIVKEEEQREERLRKAGNSSRVRAKRYLREGRISKVAYDAVISGDITLGRALEFGPDAPEDTTDHYHRIQPEGGKKTRPGSCLCGCGEIPVTKNGRFIPGHDARMVRLAGLWLSADMDLSADQIDYCIERGLMD